MKKDLTSLTKNDSNRLNELEKLIDMAGELFNKKVNSANWTAKQEILYLNFSAVNNYAEAITILCKEKRPFPAVVVLRSIVESYINTAYMLTHNSDKRVILFSMEDSYYRKGIAVEVNTFLNKYPEYEDDNFNRKIFNNALNIIDKELDLYNEKFNFGFKNKDDFKKKYHTNLLERAKMVDRKIKKPLFEHIYIIVYRYFSEFGHLNARGLNHFVIKGEGGNNYIVASQYNEVDYIIATTYTMYLYFLLKLKDYRLLDKKFPLKDFVNYWEKEYNLKISPVDINHDPK